MIEQSACNAQGRQYCQQGEKMSGDCHRYLRYRAVNSRQTLIYRYMITPGQGYCPALPGDRIKRFHKSMQGPDARPAHSIEKTLGIRLGLLSCPEPRSEVQRY